MTLKQAKINMKALGLTINKNIHGEYRVNFVSGREATAYYTDDITDATLTGYLMARRQQLLQGGKA